MQNVIKKVVWACLAVIPFIVLYVADGGTFDIFGWFSGSGMFFPFISGKNLLFRILVEVAFAGWAVLALYDSSYRINIKKSPIMIAYGLFIVVLLLADLFGVDREKSMWSNFERMEGFVGHIHFFAYFFVLTVMIRTLADWQKLWKIFIAADILVLLYATGQFLGAKGLIVANNFPKLAEWFSSRFAIHQSQNRLDATIGNSAYFAIFCLMYFFIAAVLWSQSKEPKKQWFYPVLMFVNFLGVLYSGTRGTMIALVVGCFVTFGIIALKKKGGLLRMFAATSVISVVLISSIFIFKDSAMVKSSSVLSRIATISPKDTTGDSRLAMWTISYDAWKERPLLGYGQDNFSYVFARKFLPERMCNLEPWYDRSHNVFFDWLVAAGALGLITYLSLYAVTLWFMWKKKDHAMPLVEKAVLTGLLIGYFIHNFFVFDNLTSYILFFAVLAYITVRTREELPSHGSPLFDKEMMNLLVVPVIGLVLIITQYYLNYRPLLVNNLVIKAMSFSQYATKMPFADAVKIQQDAFTNAIAMNTLGSLEAREQFLQMAMRMAQIKIPETLPAGEKQATVQALNGILLAARNDVEKSYQDYSEDVRMLSIYGLFFNGIGDSASAEKVFKRAMEYAPNKQLIAFDLIRAYLIQQKFSDAYALGKSTYDLSINCNSALKWYMMGAAYAGQYKEALAYTTSQLSSDTVKESDKKFLTAEIPKVSLDQDVIAGVLSSGQINVGIDLLNQLKKQDPSLAQQIDAYIKQLLVAPRK